MTPRPERRRLASGWSRRPTTFAACAAFLVATEASAQRRPPSAPPMRIAVFDSRVVFDSLPERAAAESEFALEQTKARTMLAAATDSLRAALDEFTRVEQVLSPRQREATVLHLRAKELLVEEMVANLDQVILRRHGELQAPMRERVRDAVREVRRQQRYDLVLDLAVEGAVVDADARVDITSAVLRQLRASRPAVSRAGWPK